MTLFTPLDLQNYITARVIDARLITGLGETPAVPAAAQALGVRSEQIIKTLLFLIERPGEAAFPVVVISYGEKRVDKQRLAAHFGVGKKRVNLAPSDIVLETLGYPAGGVPPFGHRQALSVLLDRGILALVECYDERIYGGGGDDQTMMELTVSELLRTVSPQMIEL